MRTSCHYKCTPFDVEKGCLIPLKSFSLQNVQRQSAPVRGHIWTCTVRAHTHTPSEKKHRKIPHEREAAQASLQVSEISFTPTEGAIHHTGKQGLVQSVENAARAASKYRLNGQNLGFLERKKKAAIQRPLVFLLPKRRQPTCHTALQQRPHFTTQTACSDSIHKMNATKDTEGK